MKILIILFLTFSMVNSSFAQQDTAQNDAVYNVQAEISVLKNRTLECKVRNHSVIVDQPQALGADDLGPTPPEMLAIAYGSCVVSTGIQAALLILMKFYKCLHKSIFANLKPIEVFFIRCVYLLFAYLTSI